MKVSGPSSPGQTASAKGPARAHGGFLLGGAEAAQGPSQAAPTGGVTGVSSIDALLALQAVGTPGERRRRAVRRAGKLLDVLDEIKIGLLDGAIPMDALDRLVGAMRDQRDATDDTRLEGVLDEIETRAAVEMAKLEIMRAAA